MSADRCAYCDKAKVGRPNAHIDWYCSPGCVDAARRQVTPPPPTALYEVLCFACNRPWPESRTVYRLTRPQYLRMGLEVQKDRCSHCRGSLFIEPLDTMRHHGNVYTDPLRQVLISGSGGAAR